MSIDVKNMGKIRSIFFFFNGYHSCELTKKNFYLTQTYEGFLIAHNIKREGFENQMIWNF